MSDRSSEEVMTSAALAVQEKWSAFDDEDDKVDGGNCGVDGGNCGGIEKSARTA